MRKLVYICLIICLSTGSFFSYGSTGILTNTNFDSHTTLTILLKRESNKKATQEEFDRVLTAIESKKSKYNTEKQYLEFIYKYVHKKVLKKYKTYVTVGETLSKSGYYDCLTGTLLYGLILEELGFKYTIREFNYHVLLIVNTSDEEILIESTDPIDGFVVGETAVNERIALYKKHDRKKVRASLYSISNLLDNEITLSQLTGLHFYNQAIFNLNCMNYEQAKKEIKMAYILYPSQRIKEITALITQNDWQNIIASND